MNGAEVASPRKKLWVAAIDIDFQGKPDPSHPAFYLPGQALEAGPRARHVRKSGAHDTSTPLATDAALCSAVSRRSSTGQRHRGDEPSAALAVRLADERPRML